MIGINQLRLTAAQSRVARGVVARSVAILGSVIFLVGLVWFAHFSFSRRAYFLSLVTMVAGALLVIAGAATWRDILFSVRQYFRRS
jgi:uncharacterized membrane protein YiaA